MSRLVPFFPALFVVLWSTGFVGARYAMPHAEPFTFLTLRFVLALAVLLAFVRLSGARRPAVRPALHAAFAGSLIHGIYLGGVFFAIRHGLPAGIAALIVGLQPLLTALMAAPLLGERVSARHWAGLGVGLIGVALVLLPKLESGSAYPVETLVPVFAGVAAISVGTIWQKRFVGALDLRVGTALQYAGALVPVALAAALTETAIVEWTGEFVLALLWLTFVLSIGAVFLLLFLIREGALSGVASLMYLVPAVTAVMGFVLFGEALSPLQLVGMAVTGLGVAVATRSARTAAPAPGGT